MEFARFFLFIRLPPCFAPMSVPNFLIRDVVHNDAGFSGAEMHLNSVFSLFFFFFLFSCFLPNRRVLQNINFPWTLDPGWRLFHSGAEER